MLDLLIIGSGPAALTAAIYATRANLNVRVVERGKIGGELPDIAHIANFPAFDGTGAELATRLKEQAESTGTQITYGNAEQITQAGDTFTVTIDGEPVQAKSVLLATGSEPRPLSFTPEPPVSYCALCDAPLYKDKNLLAIGGGNSAVGESLMLAKIARALTLMTHSQLKAEATRIEQLKSLRNVTILENTEPTPENTKGYDGIFVYIGKRPASTLLEPEHLDDAGYIQTQPGTHLVTPGLYAAGDVRLGTLKQAVTAAADGAEAATEIIKYLQSHDL